MHWRFLALILSGAVCACTTTVYPRSNAAIATKSVDPNSWIGWKGIHVSAGTGPFGEGNDVELKDCIPTAGTSAGRLLQRSLVRDMRNVKGVNPRCVVTFKDYVYKFAIGTPVLEPTTICVDVYVSSPSGVVNSDTGVVDCDVYVFPDNEPMPGGTK